MRLHFDENFKNHMIQTSCTSRKKEKQDRQRIRRKSSFSFLLNKPKHKIADHLTDRWIDKQTNYSTDSLPVGETKCLFSIRQAQTSNASVQIILMFSDVFPTFATSPFLSFPFFFFFLLFSVCRVHSFPPPSFSSKRRQEANRHPIIFLSVCLYPSRCDGVCVCVVVCVCVMVCVRMCM